MIPKIIHYVWVGTNEKPELVLRCMASWKRFLPDYQIIEWGNDSLENIENAYVKEAFQMKKWAFVSDYLRLYALFHHGGFYFDTDLEVTANLDVFLNHNYLTGFENFKGNSSEAYPITALMGCNKHNPLVTKMLAEYDNEHFILSDGSLNILTNTKRITQLKIREFNLKETMDSSQTLILEPDSIVYPSFFFSTPEKGKSNYSIHHFDGSWHENFTRRTLAKLFDYKIVLFSKKNNNKAFNYMHYGDEVFVCDIGIGNSYRICILQKKRSI